VAEDGIAVSLRTFDDIVLDGYRSLFPGDPEKTLDQLNWRFRSNPHGEARFAIACAGDVVVGMIALVPTRLRTATDDGLCYQAIDTAVHPSWQGQGLFVKIGRVAQDAANLGAEILWGFPNANAAPGWYDRLGWTNFGPVPLLMRPLRSSFLLGRLHSRLRSIDVPLVRSFNLAPHVYGRGCEPGDEVASLWARVERDFGVAVKRDGRWIDWRLMEKPDSDYRCVGLKSNAGDLEAFAAIKIADKHGGRLCYVMEAICAADRTEDLARLLRSELSLAARSGAEVALAWCPRTAPNYRAYRKAGFWPVPPRLRPIEINFGARALGEASADVIAANWYVSFLDSDTN
jgi:GNAT superfamily N-acetyltransferase